jgi:hypothetical protein
MSMWWYWVVSEHDLGLDQTMQNRLSAALLSGPFFLYTGRSRFFNFAHNQAEGGCQGGTISLRGTQMYPNVRTDSGWLHEALCARQIWMVSERPRHWKIARSDMSLQEPEKQRNVDSGSLSFLFTIGFLGGSNGIWQTWWDIANTLLTKVISEWECWSIPVAEMIIMRLGSHAYTYMIYLTLTLLVF